MYQISYMKKLFIASLLALTSICTYGQEKETKETKKAKDAKAQTSEKRPKCAKIYLALSTGFNNNTGALGLNIDVPVSKEISVDAGFGRSTWGNKLFVGGKYFLNPCHIGWAFGGGVTYNTGLSNFVTKRETIYKTQEEVLLNMKPMVNAYFVAYKYWKLGKGYNRIYMELGYSVAFTNDILEQLDGTPMSSDGIALSKALSPGGPILAGGISFGIK